MVFNNSDTVDFRNGITRAMFNRCALIVNKPSEKLKAKKMMPKWPK